MLRPQLANAEIWTVEGGSVEAATELARAAARGLLRRAWSGSAAAARSTSPSTPRALQRAADGRGRHEPRPRRHRLAGRLARGRRPQGLLRRADADRGRGRPRLRAPQRARRMRRSGIGDAISQPRRRSPTGGWPSASAASRSTASRSRSRAPPRRRSCTARTGSTTTTFLIALAEALVLSGLAMATAGSSRPCSGGDHEILHAIDHLFPGTAHHGELAGAAQPVHVASCAATTALARDIDACLRAPRAAAHARRPRAQRASSSPQAVVARAGDAARTATRSSSTSTSTSEEREASASARSSTPSIAELRAATQPPSIFERNSGEHWAGRLYMRRFSPYLTRLLLPHARSRRTRVTWLMIARRRLAAAALLTLPGVLPARRRGRC